MRNECNVIKDILPLYVEGMLSEDSISFVEEHIADCPECKAFLEKIKAPSDISEDKSVFCEEAMPLKKAKKKFRVRNKILGLVYAILILIVIISAGFVFDRALPAKKDYGESEIYTKEEIKAAIDAFCEYYDNLRHYGDASDIVGFYSYKVYNVRYVGDEYNNYGTIALIADIRAPYLGMLAGGWSNGNTREMAGIMKRKDDGTWEYITSYLPWYLELVR